MNTRRPSASLPRLAAFTMVELMVVISIIVMAAGLLVPTIADFMKNRQIEGVRGQISNVINMARLQAVTKRRAVSVVFFREGPRVYDEVSKDFTDADTWNPQSSLLGEDDAKIWYALGFAGGKSSVDPGYEQDGYKPQGLTIPPFSMWDKKRGTAGLYKVTFQRDGTLGFVGGNDVPSSVFNDESRGAPPTADIVILQIDSAAAGFIDLRPTGQLRGKVRTLENPPYEYGDVAAIAGASRTETRGTGRGKTGRS
jgi:type II secretory pathway pseudopilin PulG